MPRLPYSALAAALNTVTILAQAGNEVVFVGTSTSGSTDMHAFVASGTGTIVQQAGNVYTDNVTDAVWANTGRNLYVGQSLQNRVSRAVWNGSAATWSTFYTATGACYGLGLDTFRQRLWVLTGPGSSRELHCLDADPGSPTYGALLAFTSSLSSASRERWALSPSGNLAAVPHVFLSSGLFQLVDTNPASPTFLQTIVSTTVPNAIALGFSFVAACAVSLDDAYAYVLYAGIPPAGYLAVWDVAASQWLDFDAAASGQQDFLITVPVPNGMALSLDRSFAVVAGQAGGGGVMRINFDYAVPANTVGTTYPGLTVPNCNGISLSPEGGRVAVTSTPASVSPPGTLVIFDAQSGAVLHSVALPDMWNIYTTAWQDASPTASYTQYGTGCAGALGVPVLQATPGSRPALGTTFTADVLHLPFAIALVTLGLSNTMTSTSLPLPFPLDVIGMPGCHLLADPLVLNLAVGTGSSASWSWTLPSSPDVFGITFFNQAFSLDPAANPFGFTVSNGGAGFIGY
ncbi:MAG TPA: hypothetical protein VFT55_01625 [Planctomycetota bacterium]|nr:hypothetical protein [Planctomycetota bacterium]